MGPKAGPLSVSPVFLFFFRLAYKPSGFSAGFVNSLSHDAISGHPSGMAFLLDFTVRVHCMTAK